MPKKERLTHPEQFDIVYKEGITQTDRFLVLKIRPNQLEITRFGISVSKRIGNAVVRNHVKRVLREIFRLGNLAPGWDIVAVARKATPIGNYTQLCRSVFALLSRAGIRGK